MRNKNIFKYVNYKGFINSVKGIKYLKIINKTGFYIYKI